MAMKSRPSEALLQKLIKRTKTNLEIAKMFATSSAKILQKRPNEGAWNTLECLAHLNHYSDYYIPEIRQQIKASKHPNEEMFTSSRLGNYFATGMKPGPQIKKIKTFKSANPINFEQPLGKEVIETFINYQEQTLVLLEAAYQVSLTKTKTGISITNLIKLRLGDTFRVVVYHNWRHLEQALHASGLKFEPLAV